MNFYLIPQEIKDKSMKEFLAAVFNSLSQLPMEEPINTPSADFTDKEKYGIVIYIKTAIWMYIVELSVGAENLDKVMKAYFNDWKFKHPYPENLKAEFEKELNMKFDDIFSMLDKKGKFG